MRRHSRNRRRDRRLRSELDVPPKLFVVLIVTPTNVIVEDADEVAPSSPHKRQHRQLSALFANPITSKSAYPGLTTGSERWPPQFGASYRKHAASASGPAEVTFAVRPSGRAVAVLEASAPREDVRRDER